MPSGDDLAAALAANFAPWVQALDIRFEALHPDGVTLAVPAKPELARVGGIVCGQAMMALADTAMALAIARVRGGFLPMTTVNQTTTFLRPAAGERLFARARVLRLGRSLAYGEVLLHAGDETRPVAHATSSYMLLDVTAPAPAGE